MGRGWAILLGALGFVPGAVASEAEAGPLSLTVPADASGQESEISVQVRGQVFFSTRVRREEDEAFQPRLLLNRARLRLRVAYGDWVRVTLAPEFASEVSVGGTPAQGNSQDPSDYYLDLTPISSLRARLGQSKAPFGLFETMNRFRLPAQRRGLLSSIIAERLGFGGRKLGASARWRAKGVAFGPAIEAGAYRTSRASDSFDGALRISARKNKGLTVALSGYLRGDATSDSSHGLAGSANALFERKQLFVEAEAMLGRARHLLLAGEVPGENASFFGAQLLVSHGFKLIRRAWIEPYLGFALFDPSLSTKDDLGGTLRGGVNLRFHKIMRIGLELERRAGQAGFVLSDATTATVFFGVSLEA